MGEHHRPGRRHFASRLNERTDMADFDLIIAGAGLSGMSLACHLARSSLSRKSILLVDNGFDRLPERCWAFWSKEPGLFEPSVSKTWDRLRYVGRGFQGVLDIAPYRYRLVRSDDFFWQARAELATFPNIEFRQGHVGHIEDGREQAMVFVDGQPISGRWVFDGRGFQKLQRANGDGRNLHMQFLGWEIRTDHPAIEPEVATLMDFRTQQNGGIAFIYLLPLSEEQALVEYTSFAPHTLAPASCELALREYLAGSAGLVEYEVERRESGRLPLANRRFSRRLGQRVMAIGLRGGLLKPSTGYAYQRIQRDSVAIVASLETEGHPFAVEVDPWRYRASDSLLLEIMTERPQEIEPIFSALFRNNSPDKVLRFLDQDVTPLEQLRMIPTMPSRPFIKQLFERVYH